MVGAQNAGKSSLINALKDVAGSRKATADLTTAALPGTTLGTTQVHGLPLRGKSRCFDTPGVPNPHQYTALLKGAPPAAWRKRFASLRRHQVFGAVDHAHQLCCNTNVHIAAAMSWPARPLVEG